jgi:hypothetical protein
MRCENGHTNLFEIRTGADSSDVARVYAEAEALLRQCKYCKATLLLGRVFATEQIPLRMWSTIWGYTCHCGERVEVARIESGHTVVSIPPAK